MDWNEQGGAAFPIPHSNEAGAPEAEWGMSLRDWFAGQALTGLAAAIPGPGCAEWDYYPGAAYHIADAMLAKRAVPSVAGGAPDMLAEMKAAAGYLRNAQIDLETGATKVTAIRTIQGGLKRLEAAIAKAEGGAA
jgi:hypothetical protein